MLGFEDPRRFLSRHGLRPKDSFGQCFLIAPHVAEAIVAALGARPDETAIEIGTGCGTLARMIAPTARRVIAIERDREMMAALRSEPIGPNVELTEADAASYDYAATADSEPSVIVGNLPYQITGKLIRAIMTPPIRWRIAVVMVQKEVALRLSAAPGTREWGVAGVFANAACEIEKLLDAAPGCFYPAPRVTSSVLVLRPRAQPLARETEHFQLLVHTIFASRRKTILNGLTRMPGVGRERAAAACARLGIDSMRRPETFTVPELAALDEALHPAPD